jgi:hypothetical protein
MRAPTASARTRPLASTRVSASRGGTRGRPASGMQRRLLRFCAENRRVEAPFRAIALAALVGVVVFPVLVVLDRVVVGHW